MAQQNLNSPATSAMGPNSGDSAERGDKWKDALDKAQANFTELYSLVGAAEETSAIATAKAEAIAAAAAAALLAHVPVIGTVGDVRDVIGAGVPAATAQATLTVNPAGINNSLDYTAVAYGAVGNNITIEYVDPSANDAVLSVDVTGSAIVVNLATDGAGVITSTAADVLAAIEADAPADALVTVANTTLNDGSGVVTAIAEAPLANGTGIADAIGVAGIGSRYTDITNGTLYLNTGTKAVPVWTQLAPVA